MKKGISILGSTGSIGRQTLEVINALHSRFKIIGLSAKDNVALLEEQIKKTSPKLVSVDNENSAKKLISRLGKTTTTIYSGGKGLEKISVEKENDILVVAIPGIGGLGPTLSAIELGKTVALASKEVLVSAGEIVMALAKKKKAKILPIDSEHSAITQCLRGEDEKKIKRLILTASGGPFLERSAKELEKVTPDEALGHPTWKMGKKITIDSATLMNKGFEVIEAHHLFGVDYSRIDVIIHPQSIVHSLVEFEDGSIIAQMGGPDMRIPIQYALLDLERHENGWAKLELSDIGILSFKKVDKDKFPCLELAYTAGRAGGSLPAVMQAADEAAVELFLEEKIKFTEISKIIKDVMQRHEVVNDPSIEDIMNADRWAKDEVRTLI